MHFIPLHLHPYYRDRFGYKPEDFPNASAVFDRIVSLPIYPEHDRIGRRKGYRGCNQYYKGKPTLTKRAFDILVSVAGLIVLLPLLLLVATAIKLDSSGPVFFRQWRVGRKFRRFGIYKFRTMIDDAFDRGLPITVGRDSRITRVGKILRKTKIDELPQLLNVLKGDMSLVGPRPEVPRYVELFRPDYEHILKVRPGLTDLASLKYSDEASILGQSANPREIMWRACFLIKFAWQRNIFNGRRCCSTPN